MLLYVWLLKPQAMTVHGNNKFIHPILGIGKHIKYRQQMVIPRKMVPIMGRASS